MMNQLDAFGVQVRYICEVEDEIRVIVIGERLLAHPPQFLDRPSGDSTLKF